jgi:hypothetical protein
MKRQAEQAPLVEALEQRHHLLAKSQEGRFQAFAIGGDDVDLARLLADNALPAAVIPATRKTGALNLQTAISGFTSHTDSRGHSANTCAEEIRLRSTPLDGKAAAGSRQIAFCNVAGDGFPLHTANIESCGVAVQACVGTGSGTAAHSDAFRRGRRRDHQTGRTR